MIVLDSSIFIAMVLPDEHSVLADSVATMLEQGDCNAIAPALFRTETANACLMAFKRGRIDRKALTGVISALPDLPVTVDHDDLLLRRTELALEFHLTLYDASYLECAERYDAQLATLDKKLAKAALEMNLSYNSDC